MKLTRIALLVTCAAVVGLHRVAPAQDTRPSDPIDAAIKNLDHDAFEVRTKAMEELRSAGEKARPALEAAKKSDSLEVRTRSESLLRELDQKAAGGLKPLSPDAEAAPPEKRRQGAAPRLEDFGDPRAYVDALGKWMEEQFQRDSRFPKFVLPGEKDLEKFLGGELDDIVVMEPHELRAGSMSITTHKDGERSTYKQGPGGISITVTRKNEAGEPVTETWEAKDEAEFKTKYPDVWEKYQPGESGLRFEVRHPGAPRFWTGRPRAPKAPTGEPAPPPPLAIERVADQPRLGVVTSPVPPILDKHLKLHGEGVVIESVEPGSLAARLGMKEHDVLVALDGEIVKSREDVVRVMGRKDAPATATAKVVREGVLADLSAAR